MHLLSVTFLLAAATSAAARAPCSNPVPKSPYPAKYPCAKPGTISKPKALHQYSKTNLHKCSKSCYNNKSCKTFSINLETNSCTLYGAALDAMGFKANKDGPTPKDPCLFYSIQCFTCPPPKTTSTSSSTTTTTTSTSTSSSSSTSPSGTPPCVPLSGNLLQNGDFEASDTSYAPWTYNTGGDNTQPSPTVISPGADGSDNAFSVEVNYDATPPDDTNTYLEQVLTNGVCANTTYAFSFDYMLNNLTPYSGFRVFACNQEVVLIVNSDEQANTWLSSNTTLTGCDDNYADVQIYMQVGQDTGEETFGLDNIAFTLLS